MPDPSKRNTIFAVELTEDDWFHIDQAMWHMQDFKASVGADDAARNWERRRDRLKRAFTRSIEVAASTPPTPDTAADR